MLEGYKKDGMVLMYGKDLPDGTRKLYASHIKKVLQYDRNRNGGGQGSPARMVLLHEDTYRIVIKDGAMKAHLVGGADAAIGLKSRRVVLNSQKTPLHWESTKDVNVHMMIKRIGCLLSDLPNINLKF